MKTPALRFACLLLFAAAAAAQPPPASTLSPKERDARFLNEIGRGTLAGEKAGWLATQKGSTEAVKTLGRKLLDDDGTLRGQIKALTAVRGAIPPGEPSAETARELSVLGKADGVDFDRQFATWAVQSRKEAIRAFEAASAEGEAGDVKEFAAKFLPLLKEHLRQAEALLQAG